ncbi:MAG: hypothetical protein HFG44_09320 [Oscillospiraceae bacterium]|nr:hypothetical protein [Oscillospiraceae bacterium]
MDNEVLRVGDHVRRRIDAMPGERSEDYNIIYPIEEGTVVYIHPEGRFHTVRFDFPSGSFCESFHGIHDLFQEDTVQDETPVCGSRRRFRNVKRHSYKKHNQN